MNNSNVLSPKIQNKNHLQYLKFLIFPMITIILIVFFYFSPIYKIYFFGSQKFPHDSTFSNFWLEISFILLIPIFSLISTIILGRKWQKTQKIQLSEITFLVSVKQRNWGELLLLYPITLLMEELIFRGLIIGTLIEILPYWEVIFINGLIFSGYHIHIWFASHNKYLSFLFIQASFLFGLFLGVIFPYIGIIGCWIMHLILVTITYLNWKKFDQ